MKEEILTNIHNGQMVGIINGNIVKTNIGTYQVSDADIVWLRKQQNRKTFCNMDVKSVGQLMDGGILR